MISEWLVRRTFQNNKYHSISLKASPYCRNSDFLFNCLMKTWKEKKGGERLVFKLEPFLRVPWSSFFTWIPVLDSITQARLQVFLLRRAGGGWGMLVASHFRWLATLVACSCQPFYQVKCPVTYLWGWHLQKISFGLSRSAEMLLLVIMSGKAKISSDWNDPPTPPPCILL